MGFLRLHCTYCGDPWEVYHRDMRSPTANQCPHCFKEIDRQTWDKQIVPAFGAMDDANRELFKDHTGIHTVLFSADYIANGNFYHKGE